MEQMQLLDLALKELVELYSVQEILKEINNYEFIKNVCVYGCKDLNVNIDLLIQLYGETVGNLLYRYNTKVIDLYTFFYHMINPEHPLNTLDPKAFYDSVLIKLGKVIRYKYDLITVCNNLEIVIPSVEQNPGDVKEKISTSTLIPLNQKGCFIAAEFADNMRIDEKYSESTLDLNLYLEWDSGPEWDSDQDPDSYRIDSNRPRKK